MPNIQVRITNLAEIQAAFKSAPIKMARNLNDAIRRSALAIQRQSMINSPVLTGYLRASHQSIFEPLKATIQPMANYAIFVHEGTRYMKGRPFLLEAVEAETENINDNFQKAVQDTLDEIAREV